MTNKPIDLKRAISRINDDLEPHPGWELRVLAACEAPAPPPLPPFRRRALLAVAVVIILTGLAVMVGSIVRDLHNEQPGDPAAGAR